VRPIDFGEKMEPFKIKGKAALLLCLLCSVFTGCVHAIMPLPEGVDYQSKGYCVRAEHIEFLADLTYEDAVGEMVHEQEIFDTIFTLIDNAQEYILIDMFLFNSYKSRKNVSQAQFRTRVQFNKEERTDSVHKY